MSRIDIHADDYAETINTSIDMLDCMMNGKLDSISIVPNMKCYEECMQLLKDKIPNLPFLPKMSVHVNLVEGMSLAATDKNVLMEYSWGKLFAGSYLPWKKKALKNTLKAEVRKQIQVVSDEIEKCIQIAKSNGIVASQNALRIDSHQHSHMIPVVWEAITEVLKEDHMEVEYIRNSKEPMRVFLQDRSLWKTYKPINFVKNMILNIYSHRVDAYCDRLGLERMYLWGLVMSGHMDQERIQKLNAVMKAKADKDMRTLEILFHPGLALKDEIGEEISKDAAAFYLSNGRAVEKKAVLWYEK